MKAIVCKEYGPPDVLQLSEVEKPAPRENEVLIRIYAATVNATDPVFRKGEPFIARFFTGLRRPKYPIPGTELAQLSALSYKPPAAHCLQLIGAPT